MNRRDQATLLLLLSVCLRTTRGFSNGKVTQACGNMVPNHGYDSSSDPPPYTITVSKTQLTPGEQTKVTLSVSTLEDMSKGTTFKGFFIQARDVGKPSGGAVGSFTLMNKSISQLLTCAGTQGSAVSHTSESKKTEVEVIWTAPANPPSSVQFTATVVQKYKIYWVKIPGPVVTLTGGTPGPSFNPTTAQPTTSPAVLPNQFSSEGCGTNKSCLRDPVGCDPKTDPVCFFLSFRTEGQSVVFELSGPADGYVSFGLSLDKWMGNDEIYLCVKDGDLVDVRTTYATGRSYPQPTSEDPLRDRAWALSDGVIQCNFRRDINFNLADHSFFSLDHNYYLFMANGRADSGRIRRHDRQPLISSNQIVISGPPRDLTGSRSPLLIKYHGAFMLVAWMTTVSTGIIVARYFKPDWPESSLCGQRIWFQVHRSLMIVSVLLTCVGFILPFIYRGGWSKRAGSHAYLGCTVMVLAIIQPVMAVFRPAPNASRRYIFNWMHLAGGTIAQIIAVVAIFLGIHQQALLLPGPWSTIVLAGFVIWGVVVDLILEVHRVGFLQIGRGCSEDKANILPSSSRSHDSCFKKIVLTIFLCGNLGFLVALLNSINNV
ncbi:putative ferric-chelate reductase 1 isoform X2 [Denticeps clupeoides]|nr:ferric-chelate reductase 1 isoform X2 [Denticeps clupeoides]XP_028826211.1 ferric-chelate reductase 1 isoform X2 [Denticeps clupeoides]